MSVIRVIRVLGRVAIQATRPRGPNRPSGVAPQASSTVPGIKDRASHGTPLRVSLRSANYRLLWIPKLNSFFSSFDPCHSVSRVHGARTRSCRVPWASASLPPFLALCCLVTQSPLNNDMVLQPTDLSASGSSPSHYDLHPCRKPGTFSVLESG